MYAECTANGDDEEPAMVASVMILSCHVANATASYILDSGVFAAPEDPLMYPNPPGYAE